MSKEELAKIVKRLFIAAYDSDYDGMELILEEVTEEDKAHIFSHLDTIKGTVRDSMGWKFYGDK